MQYLLLIYSQESDSKAPKTPAERKALMEPWFDYTEALQKAGKHIAGEALKSTETATSVRSEGGKSIFTDGPFAETKEQLGGFYLIDCESLDEAMEWASKCPAVNFGCVEVRPVAELPTRKELATAG